MKHLSNFAVNGTEFSINLHIVEMPMNGREVMFITISTAESDDETDYTVVLNGLPTVKNLKRAFGSNTKAAEKVIKVLKKNAVKEACEYWFFNLSSDSEWEDGLDSVLEDYISDVKRAC